MGLEHGLAPETPKRKLRRRLLGAAARNVRATYLYDTPLWRTALAVPWTVCFVTLAVAVLGIPTGLGTPADLMLAAGAATVAMALAGHLFAVLIALTGLRIPRLFAGCALATGALVLPVLYFGDLDLVASSVIAASAALFAGLAGAAFRLLRLRRLAAGLLLTAALMLPPLALAGGLQVPEDAEPVLDESAELEALELRDPSLPGAYSFRSFTYGSGADLHRKEYGEETTLVSKPADAFSYIENWPEMRSLFWGFGPSSLPLNGRTWMPDGKGPFPLVLIAHGNHMMEDYSDAGYAYLGELLASRGFIAVSIDVNFLNYSAWTGIPDQDFKARAWMLLKHLEQLGTFGEEEGNPFYGKIDFARTALIGHSRGGQAVAMAADKDSLAEWFKDDPVLDAAGRFAIKGVVALAPTDRKVDDRQANLQDVGYLTLQGARDGDVHDFYGDRQYLRSSYSPGFPAFKASLYIGDANHSQFNTDWGGYDRTFPTGLFLSRANIMDAEEQQRIAKVYVSAFLETLLHENPSYLPLFRDYRHGTKWLPETAYFNRYQDSGFRPVARFDEDRDKATVAVPGSASARGLDWREEPAPDRERRSKGTQALVLERIAEGDEEASYTISLDEGEELRQLLEDAEGLSFSMANLNGFDDGEEGAENEESAPLPPEVDIALSDRDGNEARLELAGVMPVLPLPVTNFTLLPWLEERVADGKYKYASEAVFQTYELSFGEFTEDNPDFVPEDLAEITFSLEGEGDSVMLDDIGFYDGSLMP